MRIQKIIEAKRDGKELSGDDIRFFIHSYSQDLLPDYQASAFLMAVYLQGATFKETYAMTEAMIKSGITIDLSGIPGIKIDKHSTGGVGDKLSLTALPLVAAAGLPVAKMSGRGLAHTGGTLDKLESLPNLRVELNKEEFIKQVKDIGLCICGQTAQLVPADGKLYALRDVTATVSSIPLIAASIMSKKIAAGSDKILLDITVGNGAFMGSLADAMVLARLMIKIGEGFKRETKAILTDMDEPLGKAVGNYLELREAVSCLKGEGPADLEFLSIHFAARMLQMAGKDQPLGDLKREVKKLLDEGKALEKLLLMLQAQGGDLAALMKDQPMEDLCKETVYSTEEGWLSSVKAKEIGLAVVSLKGGRLAKGDIIDHSVGLELHVKRGHKVNLHDPLLTIYSRPQQTEKVKEIKTLIPAFFEITENKPLTKDLVIKEIGFGEV